MSDSSPPGDNARVTMAEIKKDLGYIIGRIDAIDSATRIYRASQEARISELEGCYVRVTNDFARLDERQKASTGALGVLIAIGSTIAAAVGAFVK